MLSERAVHKLRSRRSPPTCYLFDMELNGRCWHWWDERSIHNTGLITNWCVIQDTSRTTLWDRCVLVQNAMLTWMKSSLHSERLPIANGSPSSGASVWVGQELTEPTSSRSAAPHLQACCVCCSGHDSQAETEAGPAVGLCA